MFNCPEPELHDIVLGKNDTWYRIIKHCLNVRIPGKNPIDLNDYVKDQPKNEWEIMDRDGVRIHENEAFVRRALENPILRLSHPNDIYIYNEKTTDIASQFMYGTLATTSDTDNTEFLTNDWEYNLIPKDQCSWSEIINDYKELIPPSNSIIIIDRYLFNPYKKHNIDYKNGIRNVYGILNELLPNQFKGEFHIMIVFKNGEIGAHTKLIDLVSDLEKIRKRLINDFGYNIIIEVLTIKEKFDQTYEDSHDRHIFSNYYSIRASHGFSAIRPREDMKNSIYYIEKGNPVWAQTIEYKGIYSGIQKRIVKKSSLPILMSDYILSSLKSYVNELKTSNSKNGYIYVCLGNKNLSIAKEDDLNKHSIKQLRNRLLLNQQ